MALRRLLDFDAWAARRAAEALAGVAEDAPGRDVPIRAMALFAHGLAEHRLWLARVSGKAFDEDSWPMPRPGRFVEEVDGLRRRWDEVLPGRDENEKVDYVDGHGRQRSDTLGDVVTNLALHGTYHRGQIAMLLGRLDEALPATDFLLAVRAGALCGT